MSTKKFIGGLLVVALSVSLGSASSIAQCPPYQAPVIPDKFFDLALELESHLDAFALELDSVPGPSSSDVKFSATLTNAQGNRGPELLEPDALDGVRVQLDGLLAMGIDAVTVVISYPTLDENFFSDPTDAQALLDFYRQVARLVRERGLKLVVVVMDAFSHGPNAGWPIEMLEPYYRLSNQPDFDLAAYREGRAAMAVKVVAEFAPDYLTVVKEPFTSADHTGIEELDTPEESRILATTIVNAIREAGFNDVSIGAGIGNWQQDFVPFVEALLESPVDYIDIAVWTIADDVFGNSKLQRLFEIRDLVAAHNEAVAVSNPSAPPMRLAISDAWLGKGRAGEPSESTVSADTIFSRDKYDFWAPLDSSFIEQLVRFSRQNELLFFNAYGWGYFRTYVPFSEEADAMPIDESHLLWQDAFSDAIDEVRFSETARRYSVEILGFQDVEAPGIPPAFAAELVDLSAIGLTWEPALDNVGAAGYRIYRDGEWLLDTAHFIAADEDLAQATEFEYSIASFDLMCNESEQSPVAVVTTPDLDPPSMPAGLQFAGVTDSKMTLSWSPATDNVAIDGYRLYVGESEQTIELGDSVQDAAYVFDGLFPDFMLCAAVDAFDAEGNISERSEILCQRTGPDVTPPTQPQNFAGAASSETQIDLSWDRSTDNAAVWRYRLYFGSTPEALEIFATTEQTSFSIADLPPDTPLYFAVDAVDAAGNASDLHNPIQIRTLADEAAPTIPTGLGVQSATLTEITLSWQPSEDNIGVWRYQVFAGTDANALSIVASVESTSFTLSGYYPGFGLYVAVAAVDAAGNISPQSNPIYSKTVDDVTPPSVPEGFSAQGVSISRIDMAWQASLDDFHTYGYLLYVGTDPANLSLFAFTRDLEYSLGNLPDGLTLHFAVASVDIFGNISERSNVVTTATMVDLVPPTIPTNLTGFVDGSSVSLQWTPSEDEAKIWLYGIQAGVSVDSMRIIASSTTTNALVGPVPAGVRLFYSVFAVDVNGNISEMSGAIPITR